MNAMNVTACLALTLALAANPGDRPPWPGRVVEETPTAVAKRDEPPPFASRFVTFGWLSPPVEATTLARIAEMDSLGLDLLLPAVVNTGRLDDNLRRLEYARSVGMQCILWDSRLERFEHLSPESREGGALLDSIVADYSTHPAFAAYYLGDEPPSSLLPLLERIANALRVRDPRHPVWNNLFGRSHFVTRAAWLDYTKDYATRLRPALLCNDQYDFRVTGDQGYFVENAAGLAAVARAYGVPFWGTVLIVEHGPFRAITPGEVSWQIAMLLAYGARGFGYFAYWTPPVDPVWHWRPAVIDRNGNRTSWFETLRTINRNAVTVGGLLAKLTWLSTVHAGSVPLGGTRFVPDGWIQSVEGRAVLAHFADDAGRRLLFVANSDSARTQRVTLHLGSGVTACAWRADETSPPDSCLASDAVHAIDVTLAAGDYRVFRLYGSSNGPLVGGDGPRCIVRPTPARGTATLAIDHVGDRGRLELLDATGRHVWGRSLAWGSTSVVWSGQRDAAGVAPAGIYFVRVEDARGFRMLRLAWLGAH